MKKCHIFLIILFKISEIHVWDKLKSYRKAPVLEQVLSAIKSNENLLTDSQCNG